MSTLRMTVSVIKSGGRLAAACVQYMEEKVRNVLQNSSGGSVDNFIHKESSGRITYNTILNINVVMGKIIKFPTTVQKGILDFSSMCAER